MRYILTIIIVVITLTCSAQTLHKQTIKQCNSYFKKYKPLQATDSVEAYLTSGRDKWFLTLSSKDEHFRILRIEYYKKISIKRPANQKYLKGWVLRAIK